MEGSASSLAQGASALGEQDIETHRQRLDAMLTKFLNASGHELEGIEFSVARLRRSSPHPGWSQPVVYRWRAFRLRAWAILQSSDDGLVDLVTAWAPLRVYLLEGVDHALDVAKELSRRFDLSQAYGRALGVTSTENLVRQLAEPQQ